MIDHSSETGLSTGPQEPLPAVVVDVRAPGGLEVAVHEALQAAGLRREMVAIVLVPLPATEASWSTRIANHTSNDAGDGLVIDALGHEASLYGRPVPLTVREFALLHYLYERRGAVITREKLLREVWGESYGGGTRTIDIHIRRLRAKWLSKAASKRCARVTSRSPALVSTSVPGSVAVPSCTGSQACSGVGQARTVLASCP